MARNFSKKSTKTIWILCEGETEKRYFQNLKHIERKRNINIRPKVTQNKRADLLLNEAIKLKKSSQHFQKGDIIACLFDRDKNQERELKSAKLNADKNKIKIFFSNPCFEIWLLAHYENCSSCDSKEVHSYLKDRFNINTKKDTSLYELTKDNLQDAIKRCKKMKEDFEIKNTEIVSMHSNPVTQIHELIELIWGIGDG